MDDEPTLDDDLRQLANRLFAKATGMLEDAIEPADTGQSPHLTLPELAENGRRLQRAIHEIAIIAEAATIVATLDDDDHQDPWGRRR